MQNQYETPKMEVVVAEEDVITTSSDVTVNPLPGDTTVEG